MLSEGNSIAWPEQFFFSSLKGAHVIDLSLNEHVFSPTDIRFSKWANMLACCQGNILASIV